MVTPYRADGTPHGTAALVAGETYYYPLAILSGDTASRLSAHAKWDDTIVIASITVMDSNFDDVDWWSATAGDWIDEDPTTAFVGLVGAGATATNGVVAVAGGAAGGAMFHIADSGARRTRLKVIVGATGGVLEVAPWAKG